MPVDKCPEKWTGRSGRDVVACRHLVPWFLAVGLACAQPCCTGGATCVTGATQDCLCFAGVHGVQVCRADHTYGACNCMGPDAGLDVVGPVDGAVDAGRDGVAAPEATLDVNLDTGTAPSIDSSSVDAGTVDTSIPDGSVLDTAFFDADVADGVLADAGFTDGDSGCLVLVPGEFPCGTMACNGRGQVCDHASCTSGNPVPWVWVRCDGPEDCPTTMHCIWSDRGYGLCEVSTCPALPFDATASVCRCHSNADCAPPYAFCDGAYCRATPLDGGTSPTVMCDAPYYPPVAASGPGRTPGTVACGATSCDLSIQVCCDNACVARSDRIDVCDLDLGHRLVECDGPEDCLPGRVCCTGRYGQVCSPGNCDLNSFGGAVQIVCHSAADCPASFRVPYRYCMNIGGVGMCEEYPPLESDD